MSQRVARPQLHELAVDDHALFEASLEREIVAHHAQDVDIVGLAFEDAAEKINFEIKLALIGQAGQRRAGGSGFGSFIGVLTLLSHVLLPPAVVGKAGAGPAPRPLHPPTPRLIITASLRSAKQSSRSPCERRATPAYVHQVIGKASFVKRVAGSARPLRAARRSENGTRSRRPC